MCAVHLFVCAYFLTEESFDKVLRFFGELLCGPLLIFSIAPCFLFLCEEGECWKNQLETSWQNKPPTTFTPNATFDRYAFSHETG
jgi:hypothetical protein